MFGWEFGARLMFMIFVLPTLASYVPNLDPMVWIGVAFAIIICWQNIRDQLEAMFPRAFAA
jgi:hypothetical protein